LSDDDVRRHAHGLGILFMKDAQSMGMAPGGHLHLPAFWDHPFWSAVDCSAHHSRNHQEITGKIIFFLNQKFSIDYTAY
jgi:hypothetical protein